MIDAITDALFNPSGSSSTEACSSRILWQSSNVVITRQTQRNIPICALVQSLKIDGGLLAISFLHQSLLDIVNNCIVDFVEPLSQVDQVLIDKESNIRFNIRFSFF